MPLSVGELQAERERLGRVVEEAKQARARIKVINQLMVLMGVDDDLINTENPLRNGAKKGRYDGETYTDQWGRVYKAGPHKCIEVGVVTWGGYVGGQYWNGGFKDNPSSRYHADGICVNFTVLDVTSTKSSSQEAGTIQIGFFSWYFFIAATATAAAPVPQAMVTASTPRS